MQTSLKKNSKYQLELNNQIYFPTYVADWNIMKNDIRREGLIEINYLAPKGDKLIFKSRSLLAENLAHLKFDIKKELSRIFIKKDLADILSKNKFRSRKKFSPEQIIDVHQIKDYQEYFKIFNQHFE